MIVNKIYIVSWLGSRDKITLREKRKDFHSKQIAWAQAHNLEIIVYAQDYNDDEYVDGVTYIKNVGDVLPPGHARNKLLEHYYKTNDDFAIFADNDAVLYELPQHKDSIDFVERLKPLSMIDFDNIGIIIPLDPARTAFTKDIEKDSYKNNYVFKRTSRVKGSFMFIKNIKKHCQQEPKFDEKIFTVKDGKLLPGEDSDFAYTLWQMGQGTYSTNHAILNEYGRNFSTWIDDDTGRYDQHIDFFVPAMNEKHGLIFLTGVGGNDLIKGFKYYGVSTHVDCGTKVRFARDDVDRTKTLIRYGHTDIEFYALPEPMQIPDMIPTLEASDLYKTNTAFQEGVDILSGKGPNSKGHMLKLKTFTNWAVLDPKKLPTKITIPK